MNEMKKCGRFGCRSQIEGNDDETNIIGNLCEECKVYARNMLGLIDRLNAEGNSLDKYKEIISKMTPTQEEIDFEESLKIDRHKPTPRKHKGPSTNQHCIDYA